MNLKFDITLKEYKIILDILHKYLKIPAKIWIFGSRAKHKTKHNSDLDIAIESVEAIPFGILADLEEAFTDAPLPYAVDIVELKTVKTEFQNIINQHKVLLTIIGNIPKLRFPEFREVGEWEKRLLYQITTSIFDGTHQTPRYTETGIPFFSVENIVNGKASKFISVHDHRESTKKNKPERGDILITRIGSIGVSKVVDWDYEFSIYVTLATIKQDKRFNSSYLHGYIQSERYQREIQSKSLLSAVPCKINMEELRKTEILIPCYQEQQKIAACLTALDDLISAATGQLDALKRHKQGLMQQLFPTEGETVPRLRFAEFRGAGEWERKKLGDICGVLQGYGFPTAMQGNSNGKYPFCKVSDISRAVIENGGLLREAVNYINDDDIFTLRAKLIPIGSTVFAKIGEALRLNRRAFVNRQCLIDNNAVGLKGLNEVVDDYFIYITSQLIDLNKHYGGAVPSVSKSTLEAIMVIIPKYEEQQKIAACLTALDDLISAQTQKIAKLKTHKRGLMQGLFPKIEN